MDDREYIMEKWYNWKVAENTTDPNILRRILEKGNDDVVSKCAAYNPYCPPDILREILGKGNDDWVSWLAAKNPNCPVDVKYKWLRDTGKINNEHDFKLNEDLELKKFEEMIGGM